MKGQSSARMPTRPFIPPRDFRAVLRRVVSLTPSTKHFEWEAIEGGAFEFYAGQFVSLEVPRNAEPEARPYSIASAPRDDSCFDLCLNRVEGGFVSNYLCDLEANAIVNMKGPHGSFVVSQPVEQDLVFIATGTGIAPIRGMLEEIFASGKPLSRDVWLLFGVRHPETILYREEFEAWAASHPAISFCSHAQPTSRELARRDGVRAGAFAKIVRGTQRFQGLHLRAKSDGRRSAIHLEGRVRAGPQTNSLRKIRLVA